MKTYLVNWDGEGSEDASEFECDSAEEAYKKFLKENGEVNAMVCVWCKDDGDYEEFDAHFKPKIAEPEECSQTNLSERTSTIEPIAKKPENFSSNNEQLEKIYNVLNHMRWLMFGVIFLVFILPWLTSMMSTCSHQEPVNQEPHHAPLWDE